MESEYYESLRRSGPNVTRMAYMFGDTLVRSWNIYCGANRANYKAGLADKCWISRDIIACKYAGLGLHHVCIAGAVGSSSNLRDRW
jgi:hypothetical protein